MTWSPYWTKLYHSGEGWPCANGLTHYLLVTVEIHLLCLINYLVLSFTLQQFSSYRQRVSHYPLDGIRPLVPRVYGGVRCGVHDADSGAGSSSASSIISVETCGGGLDTGNDTARDSRRSPSETTSREDPRGEIYASPAIVSRIT
jgi:hypothetical protein